MKKLLFILVCVALGLLLAACRKTSAKPEPAQPEVGGAQVTLRNEAKEADFWIIPDTEENRKTTLWGTATAAKMKAGEEREITLGAPAGQFLLRVIDTDSWYHAASGVAIREGDALRLMPDPENARALLLEVTPADGAAETYEVFSARL